MRKGLIDLSRGMPFPSFFSARRLGRMFKFLHAADIHLDSPLHKLEVYEGAPVEAVRQATRRALENLIELAVSEDVAFVLIAGDVYDGDWKDYNTGLYFVSQMKRLREADIHVYLISGNHDAASKITRNLRLPEGVAHFPTDQPTSMTVPGMDVVIHGQGFLTPAVRKDLSEGYPAPLPGCFNIGLLHTCATGREGHEAYAPCTLEGLKNKGYDYWALGHVHQREVLLEEDPLIVFPGNIQGRHIRETGPKGCVLVTVDEKGRPEADFKTLDVLRWARITVSAFELEDGYEIIDRVGERLEACLEENEGLPLAARIEINGMSEAHRDLGSDPERWSNEIRAAAIDVGSGQIWVEKIDLQTSPRARMGVGQTGGPLDELLRYLDELGADPKQLTGLTKDLGDLMKKLPRELWEDGEIVPPADPGRMVRILTQVRPLLLHRLMNREDAP